MSQRIFLLMTKDKKKNIKKLSLSTRSTQTKARESSHATCELPYKPLDLLDAGGTGVDSLMSRFLVKERGREIAYRVCVVVRREWKRISEKRK